MMTSIVSEAVSVHTHCDCKSSAFCDLQHKYIVTVDLCAIENHKPRKLIPMVPNYKEIRSINYSKCVETVLSTPFE